MKCPKCGGTGVIHFRNIHVLCGKCQGIGFIDDKPKPKKQIEKPITEQEYLQTCNTEQLAELITDIRDNDIYANGGFLEPLIMKLVGVREKELRKSIVVEWLKQPHTTEVEK